MAEITYPAELKTDHDKLGAVYSLIEQMRLEHNRQGAIARGEWEQYRGKWQEYKRRYKAARLVLLQEQNRLRLALRRNAYNDTDWRALEETQRRDASDGLFGNKEQLKKIETDATCSGLDELKTVNLGGIEGSYADPLEDYTTYTEVDAEGDLTVAENTITVASMRQDVLSYVAKDKGAGALGDVDHLVSFTFGTYDNYAFICFWAITNSSSYCHKDRDTNNVGISAFAFRYDSGGGYRIALKDHTNDSEDYYVRGASTTSYMEIERAGTSGTLDIYTDAERTNLLDTLSITCGAQTYQYVMAGTAGHTTWQPNVVASGTIFDLDLQEAGGEIEKFSADSAGGQDAVAAGNPVVSAAGSETGQVTDAKAGYPDAVIEVAETVAGTEVSHLTLIKHSADSAGGDDAKAAGNPAVTAMGTENALGTDAITGYPEVEAGGVDSGGSEEAAYLQSALTPSGDIGAGIETSYREITGIVARYGSDSGVGNEIIVDILVSLTTPEVGSGMDIIGGRGLASSEAGYGIETAEPVLVWVIIDGGSGTETAVVIPVFASHDTGLGADLSILFKGACSGDIAQGVDALKALIGVVGVSTDMRLPGGSGKVKMPSEKANIPSKGVNI